MNAITTKIPTESVAHLQQEHPDSRIANLTPAEAQNLFQMKVSEIEKSSGCSYNDAFARAKLLNKQLAERMNAGPKPAFTPDNIKGHTFTPPDKKDVALGNDIPPAPVFSPQMKTMLGLPGDADQAECETAWKATRGITTPRDSQAIWKMLAALWQGRMADKPHLVVEWFMKDRFPLLASQVSL